MPEMDFDELVMRIIKASGLEHDDVIARVNAKVNELSGLVSKRGAAHIIANNFGVQLHESKKGKILQLKDVVGGLNNISVRGVVTRVFPINEFESKGRKGKVVSVIINDGTAESRLVFWNDMVKVVDDGRLNVNDFIKVHHVRSKKGNYGMELHMNNRSRIELNPDEKRPEVKSVSYPAANPERFLICDLQEGLNVEVRGCLVQLYDRNPFYDVCPDCGKSLGKDGKCTEHNEVKPAKAMVLNAVFDDGSGSIRCVLFKEQAESLLGCSTEHALKLSEERGEESAIIHDKQSLLGEEFIIAGKTAHNDFTDNLELMVRSIIRANPITEIERLRK